MPELVHKKTVTMNGRALLGPARESKVYPRRPQFEKNTSAQITPIRPLPGDSTPLGAINTAATRGGDEILFREALLQTSLALSSFEFNASCPQQIHPKTPRERDLCQRGQRPKSFNGKPQT